MAKKTGSRSCCEVPCQTGFKVESILSVDERGQMVLPKEVRDRAGIGRGDKLALVTWEKEGSICCMSLIKAEHLRDMVRGILGSMVRDVVGG